MNERPPRPPRAETREVVELKQLKATHPELASAIDLQLDLLAMQRRVQSRVPLPWNQPEKGWLVNELRQGRPAVRFGDIPIEWSDLRLTIRQTAEILQRHDALERHDFDAITPLAREGNQIEPIVRQWYGATSRRPTDETPVPMPSGLDQVLLLALRPFLARCAESLLPRPELAEWRFGHCPICAWEPDFSVITQSAERRLSCGRCTAQWSFDPIACPFCNNSDRTRITSFATRDGLYRVAGCDSCKRYLKAFDGRKAGRPAMIAVDSIATLPLDAAAIQRGYQS